MHKKYFFRGVASGAVIAIALIGFLYFNFFVQRDLALDQIEVYDLQENKKALSDYKGRPLVVNFWATWCKPCIQEFPNIDTVMGSSAPETILENKD